MDRTKDSRLLELLDAYLDSEGGGNADANSGQTAISGTFESDYLSELEKSLPDVPETAVESAISTKTGELLDAFLDKSGGMWRPMLDLTAVPEPESGQTSEEDDEDAALDSVCASGTKEVEDAYFTESLARIFLKQHRYEKALEIINSLYLNFPNKSIYFADQIRYLEKLIRINQKK